LNITLGSVELDEELGITFRVCRPKRGRVGLDHQLRGAELFVESVRELAALVGETAPQRVGLLGEHLKDSLLQVDLLPPRFPA
jgi:hypothetical protein